MSTLAELQRDFQRHVMHGHERIVDAVESTPKVPAATRLAIYSEAYRLRLTDALASTMPRLQQLLGQDEFAKVAARVHRFVPVEVRLDSLVRRSPAGAAGSLVSPPALDCRAGALGMGDRILIRCAGCEPVGVETLATVAPERIGRAAVRVSSFGAVCWNEDECADAVQGAVRGASPPQG